MCMIWVLLIGAAFYLIYKNFETNQAGTAGETPLEIAKKRYARGEISHDDFAQMKEDLQ